MGQAAGPPGAAGVPVAVAGLLLAGACGVAVTVTVLVGVAPGVEPPQAAASTATVASAAAAMARRAARTGAVIQGSLCLGGSASRTDIYDVGWAAAVDRRQPGKRQWRGAQLGTVGGPGRPPPAAAGGAAGPP